MRCRTGERRRGRRLVLLAVEVDDFFALGNERGLVSARGFEGFGGGVELADSAVDED